MDSGNDRALPLTAMVAFLVHFELLCDLSISPMELDVLGYAVDTILNAIKNDWIAALLVYFPAFIILLNGYVFPLNAELNLQSQIIAMFNKLIENQVNIYSKGLSIPKDYPSSFGWLFLLMELTLLKKNFWQQEHASLMGLTLPRNVLILRKRRFHRFREVLRIEGKLYALDNPITPEPPIGCTTSERMKHIGHECEIKYLILTSVSPEYVDQFMYLSNHEMIEEINWRFEILREVQKDLRPGGDVEEYESFVTSCKRNIFGGTIDELKGMLLVEETKMRVKVSSGRKRPLTNINEVQYIVARRLKSSDMPGSSSMPCYFKILLELANLL
ncbi:hypothetical protein E3N88_12097 [Mikania micrantha]|uniref:Uncharacterized protein n=1 Tax=Mikania micrantha TaxID=192012 RepID=A0A5N6P5W1_9ASTR|nr:hypothetical protein E3N88_12097 [Mikania micrantha]